VWISPVTLEQLVDLWDLDESSDPSDLQFIAECNGLCVTLEECEEVIRAKLEQQ